MLLEDVICGSLKSAFVLVVDNAKQKGDNIIGAMLERHKTKPVPIHALCFDCNNSNVHKRFGITTDRQVVIHDLFSDPLGWVTKSNTQINVCKYICSKVEQGSKIVIWIDSLTSALISIHQEDLYSQIHRMLRRSDEHGVEVVQLISCMHSDVDTEATVDLMSNLASTTIRVHPPPNNCPNPLYNLTHHKPNGKIFNEIRLYSIGEQGIIRSEPLKKEEKMAPPPTPAMSSAPIHDTFSTFRHALSAEEQKARDQLVLPFQRLAMGGAARGQGRIEYEPEEADEWDEDEEDPDDDLEV